MLLDNAGLTRQLKDLCHQLVITDISTHEKLLNARNSIRNVGMGIEVMEGGEKKELPHMLTANARRVQESLRALEEVSKSRDVPVVAIGGSTGNNALEVIAPGADSVAVISAVLGSPSPEEASWETAAFFEVKE